MIIYLYVKQHKLTGLKYFGKTAKYNPLTYNGSGKYWKSHIKKHGIEHIQTLEVWGFDDQDLCTEFALQFSEENDIVNSTSWANLVTENGIDGSPIGKKVSSKTRKKLSERPKEMHDRIYATRLKNGTNKLSEQTKERMRKAHEIRKATNPDSYKKKSKA